MLDARSLRVQWKPNPCRSPFTHTFCRSRRCHASFPDPDFHRFASLSPGHHRSWHCSDSGHVGPTWHQSTRNVTPILQGWRKTSHLEPRSVEWPVPAKQWPVSGHGGLTPGMSHTVPPRCYRMSHVPLVPQLTRPLNDFYWMVTTKHWPWSNVWKQGQVLGRTSNHGSDLTPKCRQ